MSNTEALIKDLRNVAYLGPASQANAIDEVSTRLRELENKLAAATSLARMYSGELRSDDMDTDEIYQLIDDTANMLRGMTLDPEIPKHAKGAMQARIQTLDEALEKLDPDLGT